MTATRIDHARTMTESSAVIFCFAAQEIAVEREDGLS
jgi:hypothetical protein